MTKYVLLPVVIVGLLIVATVAFIKFRPGGKVTELTPANQEQLRPTASMYLLPDRLTIEVGSTQPVEIKLNAVGSNITVVPVRLTYNYEESSPITVVDANSEKEGVQVAINEELALDGWVYPINQVYSDAQNSKVMIDLTLINAGITGYTPQGELTLATINILGERADSVNLNFDSTETKVLTKDVKEAILELQSATISVE